MNKRLCETRHGRRQRVVTRGDGSRVQLCERCGGIVAVLIPPGSIAHQLIPAVAAMLAADGLEAEPSAEPLHIVGRQT